MDILAINERVCKRIVDIIDVTLIDDFAILIVDLINDDVNVILLIPMFLLTFLIRVAFAINEFNKPLPGTNMNEDVGFVIDNNNLLKNLDDDINATTDTELLYDLLIS